MKGTITKIDQGKLNSWGDDVYYRIYFRMEDNSWAQTDVVPRFRNFRFWKPIIEAGVGTLVGNLGFKEGHKIKSKINADCEPYIVQEKIVKDPFNL